MRRYSFAEIAVDAAVRSVRTFTYGVPDGMGVELGQMVQVDFGSRMLDGLVIDVKDNTNLESVRPIAASDPSGPILSQKQIDVACWISEYYKSSLYSAISLMLPPGFRNRTTAYLEQIGSSLGGGDFKFLEQNVLAMFGKRSGRVNERSFRRALGPKGRSFIQDMIDHGNLRRVWKWRNPIGGSDINLIVDNRAGYSAGHLTPTPHQEAALNSIQGAITQNSYKTFLLHGVTGSGKTEVYLRALAHCIEIGKKGIVLVPEISLTPQTMERFEARFPGRVAVIHSRLPKAQHRWVWWGIKNGNYDVVVGSRSALFVPLEPLGLIVVDEEHEWTYKQQDQEPRYHARTVAMQIAQTSRATVILGSATPDIVTYHRGLQGRGLDTLNLPYRVSGSSSMANVVIVDMRKELVDGNRNIFSYDLQAALRSVVKRGDQAILFINRRGSAGVVQCRNCGYVVRCSSCELPMTYHDAPGRLICHQCSRRSRPLTSCSDCGSGSIRLLGIGTQRVVSELASLIPGVSTLRWDTDVGLEKTQDGVLERFRRGEAQVLVGTQMVAKGLHIPSVTLVGAVLADLGMHLPDFRAEERIFQLLCQVVGRAGRGAQKGNAILQTYKPDHYSISLAAEQTYNLFYQKEVSFRKMLRMPPFSRLVRLMYSHTNEVKSRGEAVKLGEVLRRELAKSAMNEIDVIGPAPSYPPRSRGRYRWHILLRGQQPSLLLEKISLDNGWVVDVDPVTVA